MYQNRTLFVTQANNVPGVTECKLLFFNVILKWHFAFFANGTKFFYASEKRKLVNAEIIAANEHYSYFGNRADAFIF